MIFNEQITFNAPVRFNAGQDRTAIKFKRGDVTPDAKFFEFFICDNIAPITITDFRNGSDCQTLNILGDGFTTVAHGSNIKTNTAANKLLSSNTVYRFTRFDDIWYESEDKNSGGGGGGAPTNAQYVVLAADGTLTNERVLQFDTANYFTVTDGGAGGNYNIVPKTIAGLVAGTYTKFTIDVKGRVTATSSLVDTDIPNLDAAKIATGIFAQARIPTSLDANARIAVLKNTGAVVGTRRTINLIEGSNITLTITDDVANERINITITSSGSGGAPTGAAYLVTAFDGTLSNERVLAFDSNDFTATDGGGNGNFNVIIKDRAIPVTSYTKVVLNSKGIVTAASNLVASDIPNLDTSKLTTGVMAAARLGTGATANTFLRGDQTYKRPNMHVTLFGGSAEVWTNMANVAKGSAQPLYNIANSTGAFADLQGYTEFRWFAFVRVAGGPNAKLFINGSTDGTTWTNQLENASGATTDLGINSVGPKVSAWATMNSALAIASAYLQVYGYTGNGTADPVFGPMGVEFR